jgi:hypothetical protein
MKVTAVAFTQASTNTTLSRFGAIFASMSRSQTTITASGLGNSLFSL